MRLSIIALIVLLAACSVTPQRPGAEQQVLHNGGHGPMMQPLPGGALILGEDTGPDGAMALELPRRVELSAFAISVREVSNADMALFLVGRNDATELVRLGDNGNPGLVVHQGVVSALPERAEQPATGVSWPGAVAYAAWLSEQTGATYALPSAAQWEYAARNAQSFGLLDMLDNDWEWTLDCFDPQFPLLAPRRDPVYLVADCSLPEIRGGTTGAPGAPARPGLRTNYFSAGHGTGVGFRVVRLQAPSDAETSR